MNYVLSSEMVKTRAKSFTNAGNSTAILSGNSAIVDNSAIVNNNYTQQPSLILPIPSNSHQSSAAANNTLILTNNSALDVDTTTNNTDTNCCNTCNKEFAKDDDSLACYSCSTWFHYKCAGLSKNQYNCLITLGDSVEWFCRKCIAHKTGSTKLTQDINHTTYTNMQTQLLTISNQVSELTTFVHSKRNNTYSSVVKSSHDKSTHKPHVVQHRHIHPVHHSSTISPPSQTHSDPSTIVVLVGANSKEHCQSPAVVQKHMCDFFPKTKLIKVTMKASGLIFLQFTSHEEATKVVDNWNASYFGSNTKVNFLKQNNNTVILRNVLYDIPDSTILNDIQSQYKSCKEVTRFVSKSGKTMPIVKAIFTDSKEVTSILEAGVFIGNLFIQPEHYQPKKQPTRCYNCQRFGHTARDCKKPSACAKCSESHATRDCTHTENIKKCVNCASVDHHTYDKSCPKYIDIYNKINNFL